MKVFITGASGFIGSAVVNELVNSGHDVIGLARSKESAQKLEQAGVEVLMGSLEDLDILKLGARQADGVIHTAFNHDFSRYDTAVAIDKAAIEAMGSALKGTDKPFLVTTGITNINARNTFIDEADAAPAAPRASETTAFELAANGIKASVIRLPRSVHGKGDYQFIPYLIELARKTGVSAYIDDGLSRWSAVHRLDAAKLFRLALENGLGGKRYQAIGDEGIITKDIATVIGEKLNLPIQSVTAENAAGHFGWMSRFFAMDMPAKAENTKKELDWQPEQLGLLQDMKENYF